ncbi:unnamed protein product, partial [Effrenium voratum]
GLDPRENPQAVELITPAPVQQESIPRLLEGDNVVIAAETGSGKSLAYMLPMVQTVRKLAKERNMDYGLAYRSSSPLALAICPTRELAIQAYKTLKLISHHAKCRVRLVHGGSLTWRKQRNEISQIVDILVCTPDRLLKFHKARDLRLEEVAYLAIDEADFLLTQGFQDLYEILDLVEQESRYKKNLRYSLITASITRPLWKIFQDDPRFRSLKVLESRALHKPQANCSHTMLLTKGRCKVRMLTQLLQADLGDESIRRGKKPRQTLVFCNTLSACKSVCYQMKEAYSSRQEKVTMMHKDMLTAERTEQLKKFAQGEVNVLVCTDLVQRGLDLPNCEHVVNFDFPLNSIDPPSVIFEVDALLFAALMPMETRFSLRKLKPMRISYTRARSQLEALLGVVVLVATLIVAYTRLVAPLEQTMLEVKHELCGGNAAFVVSYSEDTQVARGVVTTPSRDLDLRTVSQTVVDDYKFSDSSQYIWFSATLKQFQAESARSVVEEVQSAPICWETDVFQPTGKVLKALGALPWQRALLLEGEPSRPVTAALRCRAAPGKGRACGRCGYCGSEAQCPAFSRAPKKNLHSPARILGPESLATTGPQLYV